MPKSNAVWGIDIGQCALKAMRCEPLEGDKQRILATEFDFIEYPKILSQPEADPAELVREALKLFLSRNTVRGDHVAISVSGQSGLARFIKLPPVESSKIPDIVRYEARQQIPFSLDDVVWDYQKLAGGSEDEGFSLETEVGLFAMKRDQVFRALKPLDEVGIEVDYIQLAPLAIYNTMVFDQLRNLPSPEDYDPDDPPESVVVISVGTDNTDLVVTNGFRVWQRNIPLGGNHFTRALSKELKLTFAKAEHLKRNAAAASDKKAVFQAMRPVFGDMLNEVQRSIGFFTGLDRSAKIGSVVALGNAMKLPGLQRYLAQHLGYDVKTIDGFTGLTGSAVTGSPAFKDNLLSFAVTYGLCLQGAGLGALKTNLLPRELVTERIIREKKPWAVAAAAAVLVGLSANFMAHWFSWNSARLEQYRTDTQVESLVSNVSSTSARWQGELTTVQSEFDAINAVGNSLVSNVEGRVLWAEMIKTVRAALPQATNPLPEQPTWPENKERKHLHIVSMDCSRMEDLQTWFTGVAKEYRVGMVDARKTDAELDAAGAVDELAGPAEPGAADQPATADAAADSDIPEELANDPGPQGPGWVIELRGYHYYNTEERYNRENTFVRRTLVRFLADGTVRLPDPQTGRMHEVPLEELGIGYPVLVDKQLPEQVELKNPDAELAATAPNAETRQLQSVSVVERPKKLEFKVQFTWQPTPPSARPSMQSIEVPSGEPVSPPPGNITRAPGSPGRDTASFTPRGDAARPRAVADAGGE